MRLGLIVLALLLAYGCVGEAGPAETGEDVQAPAESDGAAPAEEATVPVEEVPAVDENAPAEEEIIETAPPDVWGTECENDFDCSDFGDACEYGYCVEQECVFSSSCEPGEHCFNGDCYTVSELYAEFPECSPSTACQDSCANCATGKRRCMITGHSEGNEQVDYYICVECSMEPDCSEGYRCVDSVCVPGPTD